MVNAIPMVDPIPLVDRIPMVDPIPRVDPIPMVYPMPIVNLIPIVNVRTYNPMSTIPLCFDPLPSTPVYRAINSCLKQNWMYPPAVSWAEVDVQSGELRPLPAVVDAHGEVGDQVGPVDGVLIAGF